MASLATRGLLCGCALFIFSALLEGSAETSIQDDFRFQHRSNAKGREFVFAFMDNCLREHEDVTRGPKLIITAPPDSEDIVNVNISMPTIEFFAAASIPAGDMTVVQLPSTAIAHGTGVHRNSIRVDASDEVFVYGYAEEDKHARSEGFLALPVPEVSAIGSEYVVVSLEQKRTNTRRHSTFVVVGIEIRSWITITPTATITYDGITYEAGETLNVFLDEYDVLQIKSLSDLTGTRVHSTGPVSFLSGIDCGTVKLRHSVRSGCGHMVEQLPQKDTWGKHFIYRPLMSGPNTRQGKHQSEPVQDVITKIKIIPSDYDTSVLIGTSTGRVLNELAFDLRGTETIHITAFKPVLVVAFTLYHGACEKGCRKRSPTMTTIPPLPPASSDLDFATLNATDRNKASAMNHYLSVMYDCGCFRRITWGNANPSLITQAGFATITDRVCWTQFQVAPGRYHLSSGSESGATPCFLSAYLFGHGTNGGYAFPLGIDSEWSVQPAASRLPNSAVGSEFYIAFTAYFWQNRRGPKVIIHRASSAEDDIAIQGSINSGTYSNTFIIPVGVQSIEIELPTSVILHDSRDETGSPVEVRAWGRVVVYGLNDAFGDERTDTFLALPRPMMGMEYRLVSSMIISPTSVSRLSIFIIIGLHDDTFVSLRLKAALTFRNHVHYGGTSVGFKINHHQALFFMSYDDQTGTHVLSSKPISVLSGHTCGFSFFPNEETGGYDSRCGHMLEHLPPVDRWGHQFVASAFNGYDRGDVTTYVMGSHAHTAIKINGGKEIAIREGRPHRVYLSDTRGLDVFIESNKQVLVYQVPSPRPLNHTSSYSLPSLTLVPNMDESEAIVQTLDTNMPLATFNLRHMNATASFVNIVARCSEVANVSLNGEAFESVAWSGPVASSDFCILKENLDNTISHKITSGGSKVSAVLYGFDPDSGYSCPAGL